MTEPNILAFQNADLLALIDDADERRITTIDGLAAAAGRDPSNLRKTLKRLTDEDLIKPEPLANGLTDAGRDQLAAYRRAQHGGEKRRARGQWPIDKFRPNPLNRPVRREVLADMAASMRGPAGLVQRVIATEPDANGVRMLIDGEHRWEAAKLVAAQVADEGGDLPDWLADGLPFEEAEADPATALVITLVANARRADMSPWEDAQQLLKLQQATDWSAAELARQIGRVKEGETSGLRDVQQKLKIAREATPQAIADYERTGSWDALRASVTTPKPPTLSDQIADHGPAVLQPQSSSSWIHVQTHSAPVHNIPAVRDASLALFKQDGGEGETRYRAHFRAERMDCRLYVTQPTVAGTPSLAYQAAIEDMLRREWPEAPQTLIEWADRIAGPFVVAGKDHLNASRAKEARYALGWDKRQANSGGGSRTTEDAEDDAPYVRPHNRTPVPPLPAPNYGGAARSTDDPQKTAASAVIVGAEPRPLPAPPPTLMSAHLKGLAIARTQPAEAALQLIREERLRQIEVEGFSPQTDAEQNGDFELAQAAAAYASAYAGDRDAALFWPGGWDPAMFKPTGGFRDLVRAAALIVAELERLAAGLEAQA